MHFCTRLALIHVFVLELPTFGAAQNVTVETTFYGAKDNCPPGGDIAYPRIHKIAGGVGSFINPITYAGDKSATPPGTIIYVFSLKVGRTYWG